MPCDRHAGGDRRTPDPRHDGGDEASARATLGANTAVARIACKPRELCAIYPITPSSPVSKIPADGTFPSATSAYEQRNVSDSVPE
nr:hypothetical protein [Stutzerimonas stutzeri]